MTNTNTTSSPAATNRFRWKQSVLAVAFSRKWLIIPPIAAGILFAGYMVNTQKELPRKEIKELSVSVPVVDVVSEDLQTTVVGFGSANPSRIWTAIAEVGGRIESIHPSLESGNSIKANEILVRIDSKDYELRSAQRRADLDSARASLMELEANQLADQKLLKIEKEILDVSKNDLERNRRLQQQSAVSLAELDQSQTNLLRQVQSVQNLENSLTLYPSRIASAKAKIAMAQSALDEAKRNLDRTVIKSEIEGVLSGVDLEVGQIVGGNQRLFQINDSQWIEVETQISLAQLKQLKASVQHHSDRRPTPNSQAWLSEIKAVVTSVSGTQTFTWHGTPIRLTDSVDSQTRTIGVVVRVDNASQDLSTEASSEILIDQIPLTSGAYCQVQLFARPLSSVIALPRTAIDEDKVYLVNSADRLVIRDIVCGEPVGDRVIVQSGVAEGDRVIVRPPTPTIEGMLVRPQ